MIGYNYVLGGRLPSKVDADEATKQLNAFLATCMQGFYLFIAELGLLWFTHLSGKRMLWHLANIFATTHVYRFLTKTSPSGCSVGNYMNYGVFVDQQLQYGKRWLSLSGGLAGVGGYFEGMDIWNWLQRDAGDIVDHRAHQFGFANGFLSSRWGLLKILK